MHWVTKDPFKGVRFKYIGPTNELRWQNLGPKSVDHERRSYCEGVLASHSPHAPPQNKPLPITHNQNRTCAHTFARPLPSILNFQTATVRFRTFLFHSALKRRDCVASNFLIWFSAADARSLRTRTNGPSVHTCDIEVWGLHRL